MRRTSSPSLSKGSCPALGRGDGSFAGESAEGTGALTTSPGGDGGNAAAIGYEAATGAGFAPAGGAPALASGAAGDCRAGGGSGISPVPNRPPPSGRDANSGTISNAMDI